MIKTLVLKTEGYQVSFELKTIPLRTDAFDATISFLLDPRLGVLTFTSCPAPLLLDTLQRLITYFEQHIIQLQTDAFRESAPLVPQNLLFQLQALAGGIDAPDDGEFSLRFMVNMEQPDEEITSIYVGGEAVITLEQVNRFLSSVKELLPDTFH